MKTKLTLIDIVLATALLATIVGCSALQTKPPTAVEAGLYQIVTNTVTVTNTPPPVTNYVSMPIFVTNTSGTIIISNTPPVPVVTQPPPQVVTVTNWSYLPSTNTTATIQAVGSAVNIAAPGVGTIIAGLLSVGLGIWGSLRSKQATTSTAIATNTVQAIETARNVIATLSPAAATAYNNWLMAHQQDANIANEVGALVDQVANSNLGQAAGVGAASQIITAATTPIPVATVAKPA